MRLKLSNIFILFNIALLFACQSTQESIEETIKESTEDKKETAEIVSEKTVALPKLVIPSLTPNNNSAKEITSQLESKTNEALSQIENKSSSHLNQKKIPKPTADKDLLEVYAQINELMKQPKDNEIKSQFVNKQVCKNDVEVKYIIPSELGTQNFYRAKVQLQAKIIKISDDNKTTLVKLTNWHTKNDNLAKWRPYLKTPPITKNFKLILDNNYWDNVEGWFLCTISQAT